MYVVTLVCFYVVCMCTCICLSMSLCIRTYVYVWVYKCIYKLCIRNFITYSILELPEILQGTKFKTIVQEQPS